MEHIAGYLLIGFLIATCANRHWAGSEIRLRHLMLVVVLWLPMLIILASVPKKGS